MELQKASTGPRGRESSSLFVVRRGEVYTSHQVIEAFAIGSKTLETWITEGLRVGRRGTRTRYFLGDDLINFLFGE